VFGENWLASLSAGWRPSQSVGQSVGRPASRPASRSAGQPVGRPSRSPGAPAASDAPVTADSARRLVWLGTYDVDAAIMLFERWAGWLAGAFRRGPAAQEAPQSQWHHPYGSLTTWLPPSCS